MPVAISCQDLCKTYSARPLFSGISLTLDEKDRVGLIGPNGAGKSTFCKILAGLVEADSGTVTPRKLLKAAYLAQENVYPAGADTRQVVSDSLAGLSLPAATIKTRVEQALSKVGFTAMQLPVENLSGGWCKRLALAAELVKEPDFLVLDEPTNHLDLEGVLFLEELLKSANFAFVVVSHDRTFLENVTNRTIELNAIYKAGYLSVKGPYSQFLEDRQAYMTAQSHEQQSLASKVRREAAGFNVARGQDKPSRNPESKKLVS